MRYLPLILILLAGILPPASAADSLSTVQVPVRDQSQGERQRAIGEAMETVVLRLVGRAEFLETPEVRSVTDAGSRYLRQYSYESIEPVLLEKPPGDAGEGGREMTRLAFRASFDIEAIASRLQATGVPLWARERPLTQVWVAYSTGNDRELLRQGSPTAELLDPLRRAGQRRGVPLAFPTADAAGPRMAFTDVWGVFEQPLLDAAEAADADNVLAVRLFQDSGNWVARFTLLGSTAGRESWELQASSPSDVLSAGIDRLAEDYAREFSVVATLGGGSEVNMEIENVSDLEAYGRLVNYLAGLSAVEALQLRKVEGSEIELTVQLSGTTSAVERAIELGRVLEPVGSDDVIPLGSIAGFDFSEDRILRYRYRTN